MRIGRLLLSLIPLALLAVLPATAQDSPGEEQPGGVVAILELSQNFYYAGEPLEIRISIGNQGAETVPNPVKAALYKGFRVKNEAGALLKPKGKPAGGDERLSRLGPNSFYGAVVDLVELYPEMKNAGIYEITWEGGEVESGTVLVHLIPKYDPAKSYRARVLTTEGTVEIEFFDTQSPIAVKSFIDMANAGFYDGLLFHEIHPDGFVVAGDPRFGESDRRPVVFPAEQSNLPVVSGTVLLKPVSAAPPANSSPFIIMLKSRPEWTGQLTVLGQVVAGLDVVHKIARRPSTETGSTPNYKPLKDITILKLEIEEKRSETGQ
jgi:peptidyl-prolyl cis-trans isomerase A (cyclophilin A)